MMAHQYLNQDNQVSQHSVCKYMCSPITSSGIAAISTTVHVLAVHVVPTFVERLATLIMTSCLFCVCSRHVHAYYVKLTVFHVLSADFPG